MALLPYSEVKYHFMAFSKMWTVLCQFALNLWAHYDKINLIHRPWPIAMLAVHYLSQIKLLVVSQGGPMPR